MRTYLPITNKLRNELTVGLGEKGNPDVRKKCIENFDKFVKTYAIESMYKYIPAWPIMSNKTRHSHYDINIPFAYWDHASMFVNVNGKKCIVIHTYDYDESNVKANEQLDNWCSDRGIRYTVHPIDDSWYYPGRTTMIVLQIEDDDKFYNFVVNNRKENELTGLFIVK